MKKLILKSALALVLVFSAGMSYSQNKEERNVSAFNGISLSIPADLYLSQGSPQKVVIQASDEDLAKIETEVKNEHLAIKTDSHFTHFKEVKVWITVSDIEALRVSGSGVISTETALNSHELEMKVSGSGKIKIMEFQGHEAEASISGSGDIILAGEIHEMDVNISGSGSVLAKDLKVEECDTKISGSGKCEVDATGELNAAISGSGRVTYYSNPEVDASVSGSGKVRKGDK